MKKLLDSAVINLETVCFEYNKHLVLKNINLIVKEHDFLAIVGPNGGGKTTLLKIILGLLAPKSGTVLLFGNSPTNNRHLIGYVPQHSIFDHSFPITVWETVLLGRIKNKRFLSGFSCSDKQHATEALKKVSMLDLKDQQIGKLSGGQRQRVFIARALASNPKLLILDEPTANLDPQMQEEVYTLLNELKESITIIMVTHDIGVISSYVSKVACLNNSLFVHESGKMNADTIQKVYGCPFELLAHGTPHRVLHHHHEIGENNV
jgi:zinc transport system ATP-binding protein